jgi:putative hydrolase of the HAD superfamily
VLYSGCPSVYDKLMQYYHEACIDGINKGNYKIFDRFLKENGTYNYTNLLEMIYLYRNHTPKIEPYSWVKTTLKEISDKGIKTGIITNGAAITQQNKIHALGIKNFINSYILCDSLGRDYWKPSKMCYKIMVNRFHCQPNQCLYIDDNKENFESACNMGMHGIYVICNDTLPEMIRRKINENMG